MQHTLTALTLHSQTSIGASSGLSLASLHFPDLRTLSLRNFIFDPFIGTENFILRHATTLKRLELLSCKLPIHNIIAFLSLSPTPTQNASVPEYGRWDLIWDRFAVELTALVSLNVDERHRDLQGHFGPECRYVDSKRPFPWVVNYEITHPAPTDTANGAALERFRDVVAARLEEACGST